MVPKRPNRGFPISFPDKVTLVDLVEFYMFQFDIMLGIDRLRACVASINCKTMVVKLQFPNETVYNGRVETPSIWVGSFYI